MATALSYPTISGVTAPPYLSALTEVANIQNTINFLYYGSTDSGTTPRTSPSDADGIYGMLKSLQNQVTAVQTGINVHESAKWATTGTLAAVYTDGPLPVDASGGRGVGATITFSSVGVQKIDSTTTDIILNDRILVKNGTTALPGTSSIANGIYYVSTAPTAGVAGVLTRALDSDNSVAGEMSEGDFLYVLLGDTQGNEAFMLTTSSATGTNPSGGHGAIKIGTDAVTFTQFVGVGSYYIGTTAAQLTSVSQALTGISSVAFPASGGGILTVSPAASASNFAITIPATTGTLYISGGTDVTLADGGTNASLTANNGGIVWSNASQLQILAGTATAGKLLRSGATATPAWSTATFPDTATGTGNILRADGTNWVATTATYPTSTTINQILYSSAANVISGLTTANSGVLVTSAGGVPSISTTIPAVTLTTPTVDTINTSLTTTGTAALWNTGLTTGTISIGGALTTGTVNIASSTAGAKTVNIGTSTGTVSINGTANIGKALLQTVTTSAGASTLTFSGISQIYDTLEVLYTVVTPNTAATTVSIQFSSDTATNYGYVFQSQSGGSGTTNTAPTYANGFDQTSILVPMNHPSNSAIGHITIQNYNSTAGAKIGTFNGGYDYLGDGFTNGTFHWKNRTTAVTSITLTFGGTVTGQVVTAQLFGVA